MTAPDIAESRWRKSSRSAANGACVEIAELTGAVAVRDSKDPHGPRLRFDRGSWRAFISGVQAGAFDLK
jgi:hypothetical protein